jgi:hypothetical protein
MNIRLIRLFCSNLRKKWRLNVFSLLILRSKEIGWKLLAGETFCDTKNIGAKVMISFDRSKS